MLLSQNSQATIKILLIQNKHCISKCSNEISKCPVLFTKSFLKSKEYVGDIILYTRPLYNASIEIYNENWFWSDSIHVARRSYLQLSPESAWETIRHIISPVEESESLASVS
jgi:hypothetical protein